MTKVRFTKTVQYESEGRNKGPTFEEGKTYDMEDAFAEKWLKRGVAKVIDKAEKEQPFREVGGKDKAKSDKDDKDEEDPNAPKRTDTDVARPAPGSAPATSPPKTPGR